MKKVRADLMVKNTVLACAVVFSFLSCSVKERGENVVCWVNDTIDIGEPELIDFMKDEKANVYNYFYHKYNVTNYDENVFWTTDYKGEVPFERLKDTQLKKLVKNKIKLGALKEAGFINDISYRSFLDELKEVNSKRKQIKDSGGVLFGPVEYSKMYYYNHRIATLELELQEKLFFHDPEDSLRNFYQKNPNLFYVKDTHLLIAKAPLAANQNSFKGNNGAVTNLFTSKNKIKVIVVPFTLNQESGRFFSRSNESLYTELLTANENDLTKIVVENDSLYQAKVEKVNEYLPEFEKIKGKLKILYAERKYTDQIEKLYRNAKIELTSRYNKLNFKLLN